MNSTRLGKFNISFLNEKEYHTIKREIWGKEIYYFKSSNIYPVIIDIGAHIGISVIYFKQLYPNSHILAFEPNPLSFDVLKQNIEINELNDITLINSAVYSQSGISTLYIDDSGQNWHSNSSLLKNSWTGNEKTKPIQIQSTRLDSYVKNISIIDMLKIDTEGSEENILKSHKDILSKVENIAVEYHPIIGKKINRIFEILKPYFDIQILYEGQITKNIPNNKLLTIHGKKRKQL
jgi:FkbM family methyltransferase